jgi:type II secretory pathway pseudopilin PulG
MMLLEMFKSRTILMVLTLLAVAIGVNVWSAQNPSQVSELARANDEKLAVYLEQYRAAQLEYRKTHTTFAQDLQELSAAGLQPQDREVRLEVRRADANVFCVIAEHSSGSTWFRASNLGVLRLASRSQPAPTACD